MKKIFIVTTAIILLGITAYAESYFAAKYLNAAEAEKKWGSAEFDAKKFIKASEKEKGAMAANLIKDLDLIGKPMLEVRQLIGDPDSYFFSDTIYAYEITRPGENIESWHLLFIPDKNLEKVKEIKIHKKCCYKSPF